MADVKIRDQMEVLDYCIVASECIYGFALFSPKNPRKNIAPA